jgi:hypothetical protein
MKNMKPFFLCSVLLISIHLKAQDSIPTPESIFIDKTTAGIGIGLDFGGIGGNLQICPTQNVGIFAGVGYAHFGFGYNVGVKLRSVPDVSNIQFSPFGMLMYGYNTAIEINGASSYNRYFYGPSIGLGFDYRSRWKTNGYWSLAFIIPIRSSAVQNYMNDLELNHNIAFSKGLSQFVFSIGYRKIMH